MTVFDAKRLHAGLGGARVVLPGDREYDTARRVWNGRIDRHPAAVVFARDVQDVQDVRATVTLAREGGARLFVRGGGHSVAGLAVGEGVVLDVSGLRDIEVDPVAGTARVGSGLRLGDVDRATQRFGLAVPLGTDSEVGLAGLTLGGGNGWLMGAHGATVDSLLWVQACYAETSRFGTSAVYVNSLDAGEEHRVADAYGANYERLRALKAIHDPDNVFSANHNIRPLSAIARGRDGTARTW